MPAFSALRALLAGTGTPQFVFTERTVSGLGGIFTHMRVNPAGIWSVFGWNNNAGSDASSHTSPDGTIWTERTNFMTSTGGSANRERFHGLAWDSVENRFVGNYSDAFGNKTVTQAGEANWTDSIGFTADQQISLAGFDGALLIAGGDDDFGAVMGMTSPNGAVWTRRNDYLSEFGVSTANGKGDVAAGSGMAVIPVFRAGAIPGDTSMTIATSPDGITWTLRDTPVSKNPTSSRYNPFTETWCTVGLPTGQSPNRGLIMTASDPEGTWTNRSPLVPGAAGTGFFLDVCGFPGGWMACGTFDNKAVIFNSLDNGITWSEVTTHPFFGVDDRRFDCIDYHPSGKICVGGAKNSNINDFKFMMSNN